MTLITIPQEPWPRIGGWIVPGEDCSALEYAIVRRAFCDLGILEVPLGSNRGTRIDHYAKRGGSPLGSYWCGLLVGAVFADCGAKVPREYGATKNWLPYVVDTPRIGSAILYGVNGIPHHIEIVVRLAPMMLSIGGNRSYAGTSSNNGVAVDIGPVVRRDILGYIRPVPVSAA